MSGFGVWAARDRTLISKPGNNESPVSGTSNRGYLYSEPRNYAKETQAQSLPISEHVLA